MTVLYADPSSLWYQAQRFVVTMMVVFDRRTSKASATRPTRYYETTKKLSTEEAADWKKAVSDTIDGLVPLPTNNNLTYVERDQTRMRVRILSVHESHVAELTDAAELQTETNWTLQNPIWRQRKLFQFALILVAGTLASIGAQTLLQRAIQADNSERVELLSVERDSIEIARANAAQREEIERLTLASRTELSAPSLSSTLVNLAKLQSLTPEDVFWRSVRLNSDRGDIELAASDGALSQNVFRARENVTFSGFTETSESTASISFQLRAGEHP